MTRSRTSDNDTIHDIKASLELYNNTVDVSNLNDQEQDALTNLNRFWNNPDVYRYERTLDIDKFYEIKEYHTILNTTHINRENPIDLLWWGYIEKAMAHRLTLTSKMLRFN
jgi:hypothetical protein